MSSGLIRFFVVFEELCVNTMDTALLHSSDASGGVSTRARTKYLRELSVNGLLLWDITANAP